MINMPRWQRVLILLAIALAAFFAFPNAQYSRVEQYNDANARIAVDRAEEGDEALAESWPSFLPSNLVNLGLDLRGGVHLLVEVRTEDVYAEYYNSYWATAREALREKQDEFGSVTSELGQGGLTLYLDDSSKADALVEYLENTANALGSDEYQYQVNNGSILVSLTDQAKSRIDEMTMARSLEIVRRRIDNAGTKEPTIQKQGEDRILIDVPGFGSVEEVMNLLGRTAKLTLHQVYGFVDNEAADTSFDQEVLPMVDGGFALIDRAAVVTGASITDASLGFDQAGDPSVNFKLNTKGAKAFGDYTLNHIQEPFAIVIDGEVISAPTIQAHIAGGSAQITGKFTVEEAENLAVLLRSGALPAELVVLEQSVVGPDLGQDSIDAGSLAAVIALVLVSLYIIWVYRFYGFIATMALAVNMIAIIAALSIFGSVLTLPGIAGIVLTIGMAVDANVLIFERIREEYKIKPVVIRAIDQGFARALSSILDANITTFIAAVVLYFVGTGPVRGFAITLMIGIVTSVFTAVYVTRLFVVWYIGRRKPKSLPFAERKSWLDDRHFPFMNRARTFLVLSLLLIIATVTAFALKGPNYGIDFRGGTIVKVQVEDGVSVSDMRSVVSEVFGGDISVTTNSAADEGMQGMFIRLSSDDGAEAAMDEDEISLVRETIEYSFENSEVRGVDSIGGAVSGEMVQKGLLAIAITLFAIGIYIWLRFEAAFSLGAIIALLHDVTLTIGFFVFTGFTFDLSVVAALLAIIGYSLNDTVVVYDRIRERFEFSKSVPIAQVIDNAINETLSRTLMTSGTTLLAVLAILILGGPELRSFAIAMLFGILVGTYSSIFIASPILVRLGVKREDGRKSKQSEFANIDA